MATKPFPSVLEVKVGKYAVIIDAADQNILDDGRLVVGYTATTCSVSVIRQSKPKRRLARVILDPPDHLLVDHVNGDPLDNRRRNLRIVTSAENRRNSAKRSGVSSRFKGVCWLGGHWVASITLAYKFEKIGSFTTETEAANAYDETARRYFGKFATLNFPGVGEQAALRPRSIEFLAPHKSGPTA